MTNQKQAPATNQSWVPAVIEGSLDGRGLRVALVCGRFNDLITERLLAGAKGMLRRHGVAAADVHEVWVPGAFEIPYAAATIAKAGIADAIVGLGAVIRGATGHYDQVANQVASGLQSVSLSSGLPVVFGVLTVDTIEQALERAGTKAGNKGEESALVAIEMANLSRAIASSD
ncbi:MAG: 6,7-dimethyl-8-ribityllumazine synthase [Acidimicrobiia bacterium]